MAAPATPVADFPNVDRTIAIYLDWLFGCMARRDWASVAELTVIPDGQPDPFASMAELEATGLFVVRTSLESSTVRTTGPGGVKVDLAWRVGSQIRHDRWTFLRRGGLWRVTMVEPGVPQFDGPIVGFAATVGPDGVALPRKEIASPGGIEIRLEAAPDLPDRRLLLVFPVDTCSRGGPAPLTAAMELVGDSVTLSLDAPAPGDYALAVVSSGEPMSRAAICGAPAAVLTMTT